jgi:hypothetical protein
MMQVVGERRIRNGSGGGNHGVRGLHEKERRFPVRIIAHLAGMRLVVAADAKDAADRKARIAAGDGA